MVPWVTSGGSSDWGVLLGGFLYRTAK